MEFDGTPEAGPLLARFRAHEAAALAACELVEAGFSAKDFHVVFEAPPDLPERSKGASVWFHFRQLLRRMPGRAVPPSRLQQEVYIRWPAGTESRVASPAAVSLRPGCATLVVHARDRGAEVRAMLTQHQAEIS